MRQNTSTRRNVLKKVGAVSGIAGLSALGADQASAASDAPTIYATDYVVNELQKRYTTMSTVAGALENTRLTSQTVWSSNVFDQTGHSSLIEVRDAFANWVSSQSDASSSFNVLITSEDNFTGYYQAVKDGGIVVTNGANHYDELSYDPSVFGGSQGHFYLHWMLQGVGESLGAQEGQGVVYKDDSKTNGYVRTPMTGIYSGDTQATNACGQTTYKTNDVSYFELQYTDCAMNTIEQNY